MANILGDLDWGFQPLSTGTDLTGAFYNNRGNYLKSANDPLRYQVVYTRAGMTEATEPSSSNGTATTGDIIYIKFRVEVCMSEEDANINGWETIAEITKTRDIANKRYDTDAVATGHKFTVDVSHIVADELSYSLCPIGKGTWQSNKYGGMNGGQVMQDNIVSNSASMGNPVSNYNVSKNGAWRRLKITALPYIINNANEILYASDQTSSDVITVINSVNQFEQDSLFYTKNDYAGAFQMNETATSSIYQSFKFFSRYDNFSDDSSIPMKKPIRIDEEAEYLNFYFRNASSNNISSLGFNAVRAIGIKVETFTSAGSAENTFYLNDFESNFITANTVAGKKYIRKKQDSMFTQNISPSFINDHATCKSYNDSGSAVFPYWTTYSGNKITSSTAYYRVSISRFGEYDPTETRRTSEYRYYTIDREDEKAAYAFVRFHWLNDMGAIDSYTAKRNIAEGYSISKDIVERKSVDRTWYQSNTGSAGTTLDDSLYISDTMRGGNIYKGGREVMNVNAERNLSVYTEPLNDVESKWLAKMMLSPNVWVEMDTQATKIGNKNNPYLRPSTKEYIPVIITNSDVETVNQEQGLVSFNIEYTLSHKQITQRN